MSIAGPNTDNVWGKPDGSTVQADMKSYTRFIWINTCYWMEFTFLTAAGSMEKAADASVCYSIHSTAGRLWSVGCIFSDI